MGRHLYGGQRSLVGVSFLYHSLGGPRDQTQVIGFAWQAILLALSLYQMACKRSIRTSLRVRSRRVSRSFSQFYRITCISHRLNSLKITNRLKSLTR